MMRRADVSLAGALLDVIVAGLALIALNGYALDLLGQPLTPWPPLLLAAGQLALAAVWLRPRLVFERGEAIGSLLAIAGVFLFFFLPSLPALYPPTSGVDAVHHYLLANYIAAQRALPHDLVALSPYLGEMTVYPFAPHLLVALVSQMLAASPLIVLHPFIALARGLTAGYIFLLAYRAMPAMPGRTWRALVAPLLLFAPAVYFVGALVGEEYYLGQAFAELLVVALFWRLAVGKGGAACLGLTLLTMALALAYPAWLPAALLVFAVFWLQQGGGWRERIVNLICFGVPVLALLAVFLPGRMEAGVSVLRWEGGVAVPGLDVLGWPLLVMAGIGLLAALRTARRHASIIAILAICLALTLAMLALSDLLHLAARYHVYKSLYLLIYPLAVLGAIGLAALLPTRQRRLAYTISILAVALAAVIALMSLRGAPDAAPRYVLSPDAVALAQWAKDNVDATQIGYRTEHTITSYWLHVAFLGNKREGMITNSLIDLAPMTYEEWLSGGTWPEYLLVDEAGSAPARQDVTLVRQQGKLALLRRSMIAPAKPTVQHTLRARLGDLIEVGGYSVASATVVPGQSFDISVHWWVLHWPHSPAKVYIFAHLVDDSGRAWAKVDREPLGEGFFTQRWPLGVLNTDRFLLPVPADAPPGRYRVQVGMYRGDTLQGLPVTLADGQAAERLALGPFKATLPGSDQRPSQATGHTFGDRIALLGYDLDHSAARAGQTLPLRLYWQAAAPMAEDFTVFAHLTGSDGKPLAQCDVQPRGGMYPTSIWDIGERVNVDCPLALPVTLPAGDYTLRVGLYSWPSLARLPVGGGDSVDLTVLHVRTQ